MGSHSENNKRIARNTLLLYFRMLLLTGVMAVSVTVQPEYLEVLDGKPSSGTDRE